MCTGTSILYKIPKIVVGENKTYRSPGEKWFQDLGVDVYFVQDQTCVQLMEDFIENHPDLWNEDIHDIEKKG